jgi:hypothetical protein
MDNKNQVSLTEAAISGATGSLVPLRQKFK